MTEARSKLCLESKQLGGEQEMLHCTKTMIAQLATHRNKRRISFKKRNEGILVSAAHDPALEEACSSE